MEKHAVTLRENERRRLIAIVSKGRNKASYIQRAHILLKSAEGKSDADISQMLYISESTVRRTRLRFKESGLDAALADKERPETGGLLSEAQQTYLIALACTQPPTGRERWTMELLASRLVEDGIVEHISPETVRLVLKKTD